MNKMPKIFKPDINHKLENNKDVFCSYENDFNESNITRKEVELDDLLKDPYFFRRDVIIYTKEKVYDTKIAGKMNDKIITLNNDSININDIIKLVKK